MENIGKKIKQLRISADMSADQLAEAIGKAGPNRKQYMYDIETGRIKRIDLETLSKIAAVFNVKLSDFIDPTEQPGEKIQNKEQGESLAVAIWKEKYMEILKENSELKTEVIELLKVKSK